MRVLSKFRHPNLVILMGFAVNGAQRLLVYEYLAGGDVSRRLQKCARENQAFTFLQRLSVALDAACGLSHLHNASPKVFHRDIKTANILLDRNGGAKMADFGLACLSRSSEYKVKQASGTIGYACPYYIQRGVVTEGSEVYSFGMVLIELLCNAPPACSGPNPGEILYLVNHLQGSVSRTVNMADPKAGWPPAVANKLAELAMSCVSMTENQRPRFVQIVKQLRSLIEFANGGSAASPASVVSAASPPPLSPTKRGVDLIKLECVGGVKGDSKSIVHTCTVEESLAATLPTLKVGRHVQTTLFDSLVTTDALKGTISREHFVVAFQPVTRSAERQFHATVTNNSINSISVNEKVLEKGQSSFVYNGDTIAFLALQQNAQSPTPFLTFRVEILNALIQSVRPTPVAPPPQIAKSASAASLPIPASAGSLSETEENEMNITNVVSKAGNGGVKERLEKSERTERIEAKPEPVAPGAFWLQVKAWKPQQQLSECPESLVAADPMGQVKVGRSFQPESFWRSLAPDACPAISREHFTISAVRQRASSVVDESAFAARGYRFLLACNSLNGLAVLNPNAGNPVFLQKDSPGASAFEIFDNAEIELAGIIRFVFKEALNPHAPATMASTASGTRSINVVPAAVLRPPMSVHTLGRTPILLAGSANASYIASDGEDPDDAFSKTGFPRA